MGELNFVNLTKTTFSDDYVFIEEAKKLANLLVKMRKRPLPSADKLVRAELEADVVTWNGKFFCVNFLFHTTQKITLSDQFETFLIQFFYELEKII